MKKNNRTSTGVKIIYTLAVISALITLGLFFYPTIADAWNRYISSRLETEYIQSSDDSSDYTNEIAAANQYNVELFEHGKNNISEYALNLSGDATNGQNVSGEVLNQDLYYESLLNTQNNGMMGYIEIPSIDVSIPVYHYTSEEVLSEGVGHLYGTSLPVGGPGTHAVLTGHSGLMSARLFTDLPKLQIGDEFYMNILNMKLRYEVDQIKTVLPSELDDLSIEEGKDYMTLITCTPYGINTHRLLVRGQRAENTQQENEVVKTSSFSDFIHNPIIIFVLSILVLIIGVVVIILIWKNNKRKDA